MNNAAINPVILRALEPVLADVARTTDVRLDVRPDDWSDLLDQTTAMVWLPDGSGTGISVLLSDDPTAQSNSMADQVQEIVMEALWSDGKSVSWPPCPGHPGGHPLRPQLLAGRATWTCPADGTPVAPVGDLMSD